MFVGDRMSKDLITAGPEMTIFEAKNLMTEKNIRHLPIIDGIRKTSWYCFGSGYA